MGTAQRRLGILVGGGPAPGINSVIGAATIEARNRGLEVLGFLDGFEHLVDGRTDMVRPLVIEDVSRVHALGGSILRTSRTNPTRKAEDLQRTVEALHSLSLDYLITIGGDDTALAASEVARVAGGGLRVAHVPKTIDNDLPLPAAMPTFGFETARHVGTSLVLNLLEDSRVAGRWCFVVVMGRKAGHLALGIGKSAGATLTIIPEEFPKERVSLDEISGVLEGAIWKRRAMGRKDGLAIIAEGIGEKLDPEELAKIPGAQVGHDPHGNIILGEIPLAATLRREIQRRFAARDDRISIFDVTLGYELRCAPPIAFDIDYTRTLGHGAVRFLLAEPSGEDLRYGGLVYLDGGCLHALHFGELRDPATGRTRVRMVDIGSEHYRVARDYMTRLERRDLEDPDMRTKIAQAANVAPERLDAAFAATVGATER